MSRSRINTLLGAVLFLLILSACQQEDCVDCDGGGAPVEKLKPTRLSEVDGKTMVLIPAGKFLMGTDRTDPDQTHLKIGTVKPLFLDQQPQHEVELPDFYIDKYEVTHREYARFLEETRYHDTPAHWVAGIYPEDWGDRPIINVSWGEAMAYALWAGKSLPTEEQWEKAARGTDGRTYPWGEVYEKGMANLGLDALKEPAPVGSFPKDVSPYGVYDMAGNVMEWTLSWYLPYPGSRYSNKKLGQRFKVMRGNGFQKGGHYFLEAYRYVFHRTETDPDEWYENVGFRCVLNLPVHPS